MNSREHEQVIKNSLLFAAKIPIICILAGLVLESLFYINLYYPIPRNLVSWTMQLGKILIGFGFIFYFYKICYLLLDYYQKKFVERIYIFSLALGVLKKGLKIIFVLILIDLTITLISPSVFYVMLADKIVNTIIVAAIGWILIQILNTMEVVSRKRLLTEQDHAAQAQAFYSKMHLIRNIATVVIIIVTISAILMSFNNVKNIGISLLASAGFLTAIVGLAAQTTISSFFSGLQIMFAQPIKIGDVVVIEGFKGSIEDITLSYITLNLGDERRLLTPTNYFINKHFENWSRNYDTMTRGIHIYVDYLMPIDELRKELDRILENSKLWDGKQKKLKVDNWGERTLDIIILLSARNHTDLSQLCADVREKLLTFVREKHDKFFPHTRTFNLDMKNTD